MFSNAVFVILDYLPVKHFFGPKSLNFLFCFVLVSRQTLFEDSFHQLMRLPAYELRLGSHICILIPDRYLLI